MKKSLYFLMCFIFCLCVCGCMGFTKNSSFKNDDCDNYFNTESKLDNSEYSAAVRPETSISSDKSNSLKSEDTVSSKEDIASSEQQSTASKSAEVNSAANNASSKEDSATQSRTVYTTPTGKRYHLDPDCGGKNSRDDTLENAKSKGLTPCKKCAQ